MSNYNLQNNFLMNNNQKNPSEIMPDIPISHIQTPFQKNDEERKELKISMNEKINDDKIDAQKT